MNNARLKSDIDQINFYYNYLSNFKRKHPRLSVFQKQINNTAVRGFLDPLMENRMYLFYLKICLIIIMFI